MIRNNRTINSSFKVCSCPESLFKQPYLLWHSHIVSGLLVRVNDRTRHGPQGSESLHVLVGEDCFALLPPLSQSHVQRLGCNDSAVHFRYSFCRFLGWRETDESKALALWAVCHHLQETKLCSEISQNISEQTWWILTMLFILKLIPSMVSPGYLGFVISMVICKFFNQLTIILFWTMTATSYNYRIVCLPYHLTFHLTGFWLIHASPQTHTL